MKNAAAGISAAPSIKASCTAILKHPLVSLDLRRVIGSGRRFRAGEIGRGAGGSTSMIYNRVGRTDVHLSAVGFGTCQLRLVPEAQALAALTRGFELGVNWVHTSPDYGGADELVARAIRESGRDVIPVSDGSGAMAHFEYHFERACRLFGRRTLPLWGIGCIDDQEFVGNDVWGSGGGMVEFLARKKREGRIGAVYCSTHGTPDYIADLITSGCFDAVMLAYNPLGFHVLSGYAASEGKLQEDLPANRERLFRLASAHGVSVLVMKPLAGGLLGKSKAFPPRHVLAPEREEITAQEVLRYILQQEGVTAVVPGVGNVEEAEEDGLAGHAPVSLPPERARMLEERIAAMRRTLCSRCGKCEPTCSKGLPISWLFRDATIWMNPADSFDTVPRLHYFHLYPEPTLACVLCEEQTCICPQGLDIPRELARVHDGMLDLRAEGLLPRAPRDLECVVGVDDLAARVVYAEVPRMLSAGAAVTCRLWVDNIGRWVWAREEPQAGRVVLNVICDDRVVDRVPLREDAHPGTRAYFAFELRAPRRPGDHSLRLALSCEGRGPDVDIESRTICVVRASTAWSRLVRRGRGLFAKEGEGREDSR